MHLLRSWFGLSEAVPRRFYLFSGFGLMLLKYTIDASLIYLATKIVWTPREYLSPLFTTRDHLGEPLLMILLVVTVPFLWIGASMTIRRALDAGFSGWVGLLFFLPGINYIAMVLLCMAPSAPTHRGDPEADVVPAGFYDVLLAGFVASLLGLSLFFLSVYTLESYGAALFIGTPFVMGFTSSYVFNRRALHPKRSNLLPLLMAFTLMGGSMILFALEGLVCLAMALLPALVTGWIGALVGAEVARRQGLPPQQILMLLACLPILTGLEAVHIEAPLRRVTTVLQIDAPPEQVWSHLIAFSELPEPTRWVFRLGIAYPMRARIEGTGVGAIRNCEFSTGPFVEPITVWNPGRHLAFDVIEQPEPMTESSPYQRVNAPHLLNGFRSRRGEFRLTALPRNKTRLEGTTWYTLDLFPQFYWTAWSDQLIHAIHTRVLEHIKRETEADANPPSTAQS